MLQTTKASLNTSTAEFKKVPSSTNGNGHAPNGHHHRVRRQIQHGYRRAVLRADTAVMLVKTCGMSVAEAVERLGISTKYFYAMKAVRESGNVGLHDAVLRNERPLFPSAARVRNAAAAITAYRKCSVFERGMVWLATGATTDAATLLRSLTSDQLAEVSRVLGADWIWDTMISPVVSTESTTKPATADSAWERSVAAQVDSSDAVQPSVAPRRLSSQPRGYVSQWLESLE